MSQTNNSAVSQSPPPPPRPPITLSFARPPSPRFPRWSQAYARAKALGKHVLLGLTAVWIFGGMIFFFIRFTGHFYSANERAIRAAFESILP